MLFPEPAGPHKTSRVLRGTLTMLAVVMRFALLPLLCMPSFDIIALHIIRLMSHKDIKRDACILSNFTMFNTCISIL